MTNRVALVPLDKEKIREVFSIIRVKYIEDRTCLFTFSLLRKEGKNQFVFQQKD